MLLHVVLVDEQGSGTVLLYLWSGHYVQDELHEPSYAHVLLSADAENRINLSVVNSDVETLVDLILSKFSCVEELLHEGLVKLRGLLYEGLAVFLSLVLELCRDVQKLKVSVGVLEVDVLHELDVNDTVK